MALFRARTFCVAVLVGVAVTSPAMGCMNGAGLSVRRIERQCDDKGEPPAQTIFKPHYCSPRATV